LTTKNDNYSGGINSGPLFDPAILSLTTGSNALVCDWDATSTCAYKAWSVLDEFYTWETGPNEWNKFTALEGVRFEPPLQVEYIHSEAGSKYDGTKFYLQYTGFGDLQGIPGKCVDLDNPDLTADCSQGGSVRWVPEFTIPDIVSGTTTSLTEVTDVAHPTVKYIVKALEKEERMKIADIGNCNDNDLPTKEYQLPSMDSFINPFIGSQPDVTAPPAVIGGVVQVTE
jgi:hypothetical protein